MVRVQPLADHPDQRPHRAHRAGTSTDDQDIARTRHSRKPGATGGSAKQVG
jgi:hypothetical protein